MGISIYSWSKVYTPPFSYVDDSFRVNTVQNVFEQGMEPVRAEGLNQLNGQTINSYNSFYLSTRKKLSDIFTFEQIAGSLNTITTPLKFVNGTTEKYLKFAVDSYTLVNSDDTESGRTRFQISFDANRTLSVRHLINNVEYRLCFETDNTIFFATTSTSSRYQLGYLVDSDGYLVLYRTDTEPFKVLTFNGSTLSLEPISAGSTTKGSDTLIQIQYNFTSLDYNIDSSWVSYDLNNLNLASINNERSAFDLDNQYLITTTYSEIQKGVDVNFLNLKSHISEGNVVKRGSILNTGPDETPDTDFRFYTSLNTGNDQEKGNENIVLTYAFYDKDIEVAPGTDTYFTTSSSIHPYDRLNINDTKFVVNGAYGSFAPSVSDRFKKLRKNSTSFNNGRYLVTWLSGNGQGDGYRWVDRYYYPDLIEKEAAYTLPIWNPSYDDPVDSVVYSLLNKQTIDRQPIFDKASDSFLEPNTQYVYQRVHESDFTTYLSSLSENVVFTALEPTVLDGNISQTIPVTDINETKRFTVSMDLYLKPDKTIGYSVLGNLTNYGFSILNDTSVTPTFFTMEQKTLYLYSTNHVLVAKKIFDRNVKDVIRFDGLDNYIVVCEDGYVYNLKYNNAITRLNIIPQLSSYTSFTPYSDKVAFVLNSTGSCLVVDNNTLNTSLSTATDTIGTGISSVFYHISALKGVPGTNLKTYDTNNVCYLSNNTIYKQTTRTDTATPVIQSTAGMIDYAIDRHGNYLFLHADNKLSLYNKNRVKTWSESLSTIPLSGTKCEFVREYEENYTNERLAFAGIDDQGRFQTAVWDYDGAEVSRSIVNGNLSATSSSFTNYNYFNGQNFTNTLRFKLRLENVKNKEDILTKTLTYDYSDIDEGYVNLAYTFDALRGIGRLYVNGVPKQSFTVDLAKYAFNDLFSDDITIGAEGFYNGQALSDYLKRSNLYKSRNTTIDNLAILNKALLPREVEVIGLIGQTVDPLTLSIPCGQRNNIEEILRTFKFGVPDSYSNHIKVEVKNSGITNTDLQTALKSNIENTLSKYTKGDVIIDDISFIDYTPLV